MRLCRFSGYLATTRLICLFCLCVTLASPDDCPPVDRGWWVRVCDAKTEASGVRIDLGLGGVAAQNTRRYWRDWHHGDPTEFELPFDRQDLWHARKIWLQGTTLTHKKNVYLGLGFGDHITKHYDFDDHEDHERVRDDTDEWKCP